eukprot:1049695-Amphidinium_carterae.1
MGIPHSSWTPEITRTIGPRTPAIHEFELASSAFCSKCAQAGERFHKVPIPLTKSNSRDAIDNLNKHKYVMIGEWQTNIRSLLQPRPAPLHKQHKREQRGVSSEGRPVTVRKLTSRFTRVSRSSRDFC